MIPRKIVLLLPAAVLMVYLLKSWYTTAGSNDLFWILAPTAWLVETVSGIDFYHLPAAGWVNQSHGVVIAPSCSGMNFLIMLLAMVTCRLILSPLSISYTLLSAAFSAMAAYCITLVVNALRIWISLLLYGLDIYDGLLTPETVHRIAGISIYYLFLCFSYQAVSFMLKQTVMEDKQNSGRCSGRRVSPPAVPLGCYLLFTLGVPVLNRAYGANPERFLLHGSTVLGISILITITLPASAAMLQYAGRRLYRRAQRREHAKTTDPDR